MSNGRFPIDWKWKRYHFAKENLLRLRLRMTFHVQGLLPRRCIVIFCISQISCELPILCLPVVTHFDRFHRSFISQFGSSITIYLYIIYMVSCSVFLPPPLYGSPGSTPFPSICKLLAAFLRSSLVFARSLQHF